jgi:hypothetical protein
MIHDADCAARVDALQAHFVFSGVCYGEERWDNNKGE